MSTETDNNDNDDFAAFEQSVSKGNNESLSQDDAEDAASEQEQEAPEAEAEQEDAPEQEQDEADDGDEPEAPDDDADDDKPVKKSTFDKRVKDLTFKRREAERQAAEKDEEIARLKKAMEEKGLTEDKEAVNEETDPRPDPNDFDIGELDPQFVSALSKWEARQEYSRLRAEDDKKRQSEAAAVRRQELQTKADAQFAQGVSKYEDFEEVLGNLPADAKVADETTEALLESEHFADIMYHLGQNPDEAREIASQSPVQQARYIGRLEAKFSSGQDAPTEKSKPKKAPKAAPPVQRSRGGDGQFTVPADTEDFSAFEKAYGSKKG